MSIKAKRKERGTTQTLLRSAHLTKPSNWIKRAFVRKMIKMPDGIHGTPEKSEWKGKNCLDNSKCWAFDVLCLFGRSARRKSLLRQANMKSAWNLLEAMWQNMKSTGRICCGLMRLNLSSLAWKWSAVFGTPDTAQYQKNQARWWQCHILWLLFNRRNWSFVTTICQSNNT